MGDSAMASRSPTAQQQQHETPQDGCQPAPQQSSNSRNSSNSAAAAAAKEQHNNKQQENDPPTKQMKAEGEAEAELEVNNTSASSSKQQQPGSGCSSAADNCRSSSSSSSTHTTNSSSTATVSSQQQQQRGSRVGGSKFKEKRPEPLKLNSSHQRHQLRTSQEIQPLDLSVKSAGYIPPSGSNIFLGNHNPPTTTTLETPRIIWRDNDALLVKQRLFSSTSTSANSHRLRLSSLAGDSPPITPGTPLTSAAAAAAGAATAVPSSPMLISPSAALSCSRQAGGDSFLSPLFHTRHHFQQQQQHHLSSSSLKPLSASYVTTTAQQQQHQYRAMINAAAAAAAAAAVTSSSLECSPFGSPFDSLLPPTAAGFDASFGHLSAGRGPPRRSCSTENLTGSLASAHANRPTASDHQHCQQLFGGREKRAPKQSACAPKPEDKSGAEKQHFSYSGQQIAQAVAEQQQQQHGKKSPIINVIADDLSSRDSTTNGDDTSESTSGAENSSKKQKALTPTSVANATANLLNIRLNSPSTSGHNNQKLDIDTDPLISAAYCREQQQQQRSAWGSSGELGAGRQPALSTGGCAGQSLGSISTTLNTPTLISPSHFKGGSICFLPSPTLSPMSLSVFELPSPLLMFPPPPTTGSSSYSTLAPVTTTASPTKSHPKVNSDPMLVDEAAAARQTTNPQQRPKACSDLALDSPGVSCGQMQMQLETAAGQFSVAVSEGNLAHLVTCARDKMRAQIGAYVTVADRRVANVNGQSEDDDDECTMDVDLPRVTAVQTTAAAGCYQQQQQQRPATAIPRILVSSDCRIQQQQWQSPGQQTHFAPTAGRQRETVSKRALSPQSLQTHIDVYHKERQESSSAPPDVYQGKARPKIKCVTGVPVCGSALDFHANTSSQVAGADLPPNQPAATCSQQHQVLQANNQQQQRHYQCKPTVVAAGGHAPCQAGRPTMQNVGSVRQPVAYGARPSSADPSSRTICTSQPIGQQQQQQTFYQQEPYATTCVVGHGSFLSQSAQQLQLQPAGYSADPFLQVRHQQQQQIQSVSELQIHQANGGLFPPVSSAALMSSGGQLMAPTHHNQAFQQQQQQPHQSVCGMSPAMDHSLSVDSLLHQQQPQTTTTSAMLVHGGALTKANQSLNQLQPQQVPSAAQGQQQQQRAASACSLSSTTTASMATSNNNAHHHHHQRPPPLNDQSFISGAAAAASFRPYSTTAHDEMDFERRQQSRIVANAAVAAAAAKKYRCDECSKAFTRSDMLTRHKRLHSGDRPFQCNECKQEFSRSDHLSTHMRTHTGEKPYRCKMCSYSACRKDMITRHIKVHNRSSTPTSTVAAAGPAGSNQGPPISSATSNAASAGHHQHDSSSGPASGRHQQQIVHLSGMR